MKLLIFTHTQWAFGQIHNALADQLRSRGWTVALKEWTVSHPSDFAVGYDRILTVCSRWELQGLLSYGIPRYRITVVAHAEEDIQTFIQGYGIGAFNNFASYGVVSDSLACSSVALGVTRIPTVVRLGVDVGKFRRPVASSLKTVGYAARMERKTLSGVEQKRGALAKACVEAAGLVFKATEHTPLDEMPDFYDSIDALVMPSLQEGAGLPPLEAAAAGRLVIGTPVGHMPRLAYEGLGILAPLGAEAFQKFATEVLVHYRDDAKHYREVCEEAQDSACSRDWSCVVDDWIELLEGG
jgi:glycosyltransferase involved in cell wall biosynthesis